MRAKTVMYWVATTLIALETLLGGVIDLTHGRTAVVSGPSVTQIVTSLGYPSIRAKALSRRTIPRRCGSTACSPDSVEDQNVLGITLLITSRWRYFVPPTIDSA